MFPQPLAPTNRLLQAAVFALAAVFPRPGRGDEPRLVIKAVADASWGGEIANVEAVLQSAAGELWPFFPERTLPPILVRPTGGPIVLYERGPKGEYLVRLNTGGRHWAQHAYQFAHEFCHILCDYRDVRHCNKWFEESLCETASLFALRRMAETWKTRPPYPNWRDYSAALTQYADQRIRDGQLPPGITLESWFGENADALYAHPDVREKNTVVAVALLPLLEQSPQQWNAVSYLNRRKPPSRESLADFLKAWRESCPEQHRELVTRIARQFGRAAGKLPPEEAKPAGR